MPAKKNTPTPAALERLLLAAEALVAARDDQMVTAAEWDALAAAVAAGRELVPAIPTDPAEMLETLRITKTTRRAAGAGTWAIGTIAGHAFEALVFPEHAEDASYEMGDSRISKFHLRRTGATETLASFDRGWDTWPTTDAAQQIVNLLSAGLAETVFGK